MLGNAGGDGGLGNAGIPGSFNEGSKGDGTGISRLGNAGREGIAGGDGGLGSAGIPGNDKDGIEIAGIGISGIGSVGREGIAGGDGGLGNVGIPGNDKDGGKLGIAHLLMVVSPYPSIYPSAQETVMVEALVDRLDQHLFHACEPNNESKK